MDTDLLFGIVVTLAVVAIIAVLVLLATRARRRGVAGRAMAAAMAAYDEAVHTSAHDAWVASQEQGERTAARPSPEGR